MRGLLHAWYIIICCQAVHLTQAGIKKIHLAFETLHALAEQGFQPISAVWGSLSSQTVDLAMHLKRDGVNIPGLYAHAVTGHGQTGGKQLIAVVQGRRGPGQFFHTLLTCCFLLPQFFFTDQAGIGQICQHSVPGGHLGGQHTCTQSLFQGFDRAENSALQQQ